MLFVETPTFTKRLAGRLPEDDYRRLQAELVERPEAGTVMPRTGGARKIRWAEAGRGKSGGCRVVYYFDGVATCHMLFVFAKNEASDLSEAQRHALHDHIQQHLK